MQPQHRAAAARQEACAQQAEQEPAGGAGQQRAAGSGGARDQLAPGDRFAHRPATRHPRRERSTGNGRSAMSAVRTYR